MKIRQVLVMCCAVVSALSYAQQICNPNIVLTRPDSRYELVDGALPAGSEIRDKVTKLIWQRCVRGMSWDGTTCIGSASRFTWTQALDLARAAASTSALPATTWRLPNRNELQSLVESACRFPAINVRLFPGQPTFFKIGASEEGRFTWSSSQDISSYEYAWDIDFSDGLDDDSSSRGLSFHVRLVRSGQ